MDIFDAKSSYTESDHAGYTCGCDRGWCERSDGHQDVLGRGSGAHVLRERIVHRRPLALHGGGERGTGMRPLAMSRSSGGCV